MNIFPYSWNYIEEDGISRIRIFGLNDKNESMYVAVDGFRPYVYVELPDNLPWNSVSMNQVVVKLKEITRGGILQAEGMKKKKLYFAKKVKTSDGQYVDKTYPFIKCHMKTSTDVRTLVYKLKNEVFIGGIGKIKMSTHESDANPVLQFMCARDIKPASWFTFRAPPIINEDDKESFCNHEFVANWQTFTPVVKDMVACPYILSFDIEVNSTNPNISPRFGEPGDKVFQISCVFGRNGQPESTFEKYLLTLCRNKTGEIISINTTILGDDTDVLMFETEGALLEGFKDLILEKNPQVIVGYNIFSFDLPYMYERSKVCNIEKAFCGMSCIRGMYCKKKEIKWSSSAFKNQNFMYLDAHGRMWVDMLPIIQRDYKLENYKLKTVSDNFLGVTKDPLTVKGIFKCYRMFTSDSLAIVGKYCVVDSLLVLKLFEKLQIWIGLCEMSNTCNTPIFTLFTQGQQIKIFSQVYKKCLADNIVIDKDSFVTDESCRFTGAYVFDPKPGLYDMVVSFDFSSLYPSTIIAYNIDYSTYVTDESIPDEVCHVVDFYDHIGCAHDTAVRKTKIKEKDIVCAHQRHRFMKEPPGIIPTLLRNLLDARKKTNGEMKQMTKEVEAASSDAASLEDKKRLITVLDKRQLSYKVSANSMYGSMGTRVGYLPFLPGAISTTAMGRKSIEKASTFLVDQYGANLIYGDSVSGDTPILVRYEDKTIDILRIDEMGEVWKPYDAFKAADSNRREKEQTLPFVSSGSFRLMNILEVWTGKEGWSRVCRVIRHKTLKKMYRVATHTGCVDVTEDHSLLDIHQQIIKPGELSIGTELYHSFPPIVDFLEVEIKDAMIEGKVEKCNTCGNYKLLFELRDDICKTCLGDTTFDRKEYLRNLANGLNPTLSYVWSMFFMYGDLSGQTYSITCKDTQKLYICQRILSQYEPLVQWKIKGNKLFASGEHQTYLVFKWKLLFYNRIHKKIPYFILNASDEIKKSFLSGCFHVDDNINVRGKMAAQGMYTLLQSQGYVVRIVNRLDDYTLSIVDNELGKGVKNIISLSPTTENDYVYDIETESGRFMGGVGQLILKNTDSCYINFPQYLETQKAHDLDMFCRQVETELSSLFPKPMKFAYEEHIYWRYLILTKKRYMALQCDTKGNIEDKITKRGVLLSRRDNSKYIRDTYASLILKSFYRENLDVVLMKLYEDVKQICTNHVTIKDLVVTKSIGAIEDYKIRPLSDDDKKCKKRLEELGIYHSEVNLDTLRHILTMFIQKEDVSDQVTKNHLEYVIFKEYVNLALPAQVQLAERMRERGNRVDAGERLGYIITQNGGIKAKMFEKLEDTDYFKEHAESLRLDYLYYIRLMINPIDEVLATVYEQKDLFKQFYKTRETWKKVNEQIESLFQARITLLD